MRYGGDAQFAPMDGHGRPQDFQFEGTGVGLSLVRRIVDLHGGEIRLRSAVGVGTVAEFTLDPLPGA